MPTIARHVPVKRSRGERRGPWHRTAKREWIGQQPCLISGRPAQCAHIGERGTSQKCSDEFTVPLAPEYHDQLDGRAKLPNGEIGREAFEEYYRIDLTAKAAELHAVWLGGTERRYEPIYSDVRDGDEQRDMGPTEPREPAPWMDRWS